VSSDRNDAPRRSAVGWLVAHVRAVRDSGDTGDIITGWLVKLTLALVIFGVVAFDGLSIASTKVSAADNASDAALAASVAWNSSHSGPVAYAAAEQTATQDHGTVPTRGFLIDSDGTVHLVVRKTARTVLVQHIGWLHRWAIQSGQGLAKDMS